MVPRCIQMVVKKKGATVEVPVVMLNLELMPATWGSAAYCWGIYGLQVKKHGYTLW